MIHVNQLQTRSEVWHVALNLTLYNFYCSFDFPLVLWDCLCCSWYSYWWSNLKYIYHSEIVFLNQFTLQALYFFFPYVLKKPSGFYGWASYPGFQGSMELSVVNIRGRSQALSTHFCTFFFFCFILCVRATSLGSTFSRPLWLLCFR